MRTLINPIINVDPIQLFSDGSLREIANISDKYDINVHFCIAKSGKGNISSKEK